MAPLPPSGPLSINDIRVELGQAQANSSLRALSNLAGFSTPDAISEFYGYPPTPNYRTFSIVSNGTSQGEVCSVFDPDNLDLYYYEAGGGGAAGCPIPGVTVYTDTALTAPFDGANRWYYSNSCGGNGYYILGSPNRGFIEGYQICG